MTLEQLRIFLAVTEHLHFTRAAESLFITQPAVSAAVQCLETEYGVKLFNRIGRRIELTSAGKLLQIEAQKILEQVAIAERNLRELNGLQRGNLNLGSSLTVGNYWLPEKISHFKQKYPGIEINCTLGNAEEISDGTATGRFDLGVITGEIKPSIKGVLEREVIGTDRLRIVVGRSHPWFNFPKITIEDLLTTAWVMRESGSGAQQMFERALQSWRVEISQLRVVLVLNSSEMVKAVVEGGIGAAALPELMVQKELQLGVLHAVQIVAQRSGSSTVCDIVQPIWKLKHRQRFQSRIMAAFEQFLQSPVEIAS